MSFTADYCSRGPGQIQAMLTNYIILYWLGIDESNVSAQGQNLMPCLSANTQFIDIISLS